MTDMNHRLDSIEQQLKIISNEKEPRFGSGDMSRSDEIDLKVLFLTLLKGKWWIIGLTFMFSMMGVFYAKSLPSLYKSEGIYAPTQKQGGSGLSGQLGGLASLAGVNLGHGEGNDVEQAMVLLTSWPFLEKVINKHRLQPFIVGVNGWNRETDELLWDDDIYDPVSKKWLKEYTQRNPGGPSSYETYRAFSEMITVTHDVKAGMVNISVEYFSPNLAKEWVDILVAEVNSHFQNRDMLKAKKSIEYLENKIRETSISGMQAVFYGMIESQTKTLMLAEVDDRYLLTDVVQPKVAEVRSAPRRALIVFLFTFFGAALAAVGVLIWAGWSQTRLR